MVAFSFELCVWYPLSLHSYFLNSLSYPVFQVWRLSATMVLIGEETTISLMPTIICISQIRRWYRYWMRVYMRWKTTWVWKWCPSSDLWKFMSYRRKGPWPQLYCPGPVASATASSTYHSESSIHIRCQIPEALSDWMWYDPIIWDNLKECYYIQHSVGFYHEEIRWKYKSRTDRRKEVNADTPNIPNALPIIKWPK